MTVTTVTTVTIVTRPYMYGDDSDGGDGDFQKLLIVMRDPIALLKVKSGLTHPSEVLVVPGLVDD